MMIRVLMFGSLAEVAGWRERLIEGGSLDALEATLAGENAGLGDRLSGPGVFAIVNSEMVRGDVVLTSGDEVAFIPPVSGG